MAGFPLVNRGKCLRIAGCMLACVLIISSFLLASNLKEFYSSVIFASATLSAAQTLLRFCLLCEDLFHVDQLYQDSAQALLMRIQPNTASLFFILVTIWISTTQFKNSFTFSFMPCGLSICAIYILFFIMKMEDCAAWRDHTMTQLNGLDYGSGMAHSFYFGYLRLILPASGGLGKDMKDRIQSFLETQQLNDFVFPVKKLIILIPSSGHSFPTLKDDPSQTETLEPDISPVTDIDAHVQDRSGVKGRIYRAGAYRLKVTNQGKVKFLYALIEGATPLLTFREAWTHVKQLEEHRVDIVSNFYRTLHNLLNNDPECKHLVELIYYDDEVHNIVPILQKFLLDKCDKRKVFLDP